ncbi:MAG TPA: hypothetical protein DGR79_08715 [Clostridiales bacterium]|nr:hypothetical protein [Clostridiales bacterium]
MRGLDFLLRRACGIREFTRDPDCILRLSVGRCGRDLVLSDGTTVRRGEPVGDLHLWNERVPSMPPGGPDLAWGLAFGRRMRRSLALLARAVEDDPKLRRLKAFRAAGSVMGSALPRAVAALAARLGFDVVEPEGPRGPWPRFVEFWENAYALALVWAFNPPSFEAKALMGLRRVQLWISRDRLIDTHAGPGEPPQREPESRRRGPEPGRM